MDNQKQTHYCYMLINESKRNTYVGYTVTPLKRIRQHNCEIKGGAKYTKKFGPNWSFVLVLTSPDFDNHLALSLEWHMKPHGRKQQVPGNPIDRRIALLQKALVHCKFENAPITMYVAPYYIDRFRIAMMTFLNVTVVESLHDIVKEVVKEKVVKIRAIKTITIMDPDVSTTKTIKLRKQSKQSKLQVLECLTCAKSTCDGSVGPGVDQDALSQL